MKNLNLFSLGCLLLFASAVVRAEPVSRDFITARGDRLFEGDKPFRFISWDIPNLQLIEDDLPFAELNPWRLPDRFEINDALATVRQMGGTVVRTYVISVHRTNDAPGVPRHVLGPGRFNEEAFRTLDQVIQAANEHGIRLIIPLVDNWIWQGGRAEYAGFRGKLKDDFWTDPQIIADFKETIRFVLLRTNTLTGIVYSDDPAILCWETGNELQSPAPWTRQIAAYIKSLDTNHLVMDGFNANELRPESLAMPEVDIVTTHHYPGSKTKKSFAQLIRENAAKAEGRKPYVIGEFGFVSTSQMEEAIKAIVETHTSGGLLWSLRFHDRDGGFYWHSEPSGGNQYKAFHWPGSPIGALYDEINLLAMVRHYAFEIRGIAEPPVPVPAPPTLLPITDVAAISWQGSVGASSYTVERAPKSSGPWFVAGDGIDESLAQYRPLFADQAVSSSQWYYRVRAANTTGVSEPSNLFGPVPVTHGTLVDELADFSKVHATEGGVAIQTRNSRQAKEDAYRAAGNAGDALVYQVPTSVQGFRVFAFFPHDVADLKFAGSADGKVYHDISAAEGLHFQGPGDYKYWKPVLYQAGNVGPDFKFLKIELTGETQIGRVEITYAPEKN